MIKLLITLLLFFCVCLSVNAQNKPGAKPHVTQSKALYDSIARMDSLLFNAFNSRDLETLKNIFDTDLEFYHDKGGLDNYEVTMQKFKGMIDKDNGVKRTLVTGSIEVYPIKGYGAIQTGQHRFCHPENGREDCGVFRFMHIWKSANGLWKLTRVVSYDH
ncbi:nuclear transport factor 2 family protein [Mucilaginibacter hurinus]|uniref:Nuclear transport factor 2 family protein n=1 Tax=Mucilaginibacter hurinus TaxID=2201324 RepID=A0A367GNL7_9SPHI|nr:nuclear transport factor 2 family protein [Mucilaginibacter hurinus]RCH54261.1 nuclear transport factor 2 family protein [Mucilaginibacter hurinus]